MELIVQIYGVTTAADAAMVAALGADHVGVVPEERGNWDGVTVAVANEIVAALPAPTCAVVLSLAPTVDEVLATARAVRGEFLHVVRTDLIDPAGLRHLRAATGMKIMATVEVDGPAAVTRAREIAAVADVLLLDTRDPSTGVVGATGLTHDWSISAAIVGAVGVPVLLAGGLGPDNVADAVAAVAPWGVDSETATSIPGERRRKDPDRVRRFIENARHAAARS